MGKWSLNSEGPLHVIKAFTSNAYEIEELGFDQRILKVNGKYLKKYRSMVQKIQISIE